MPTTVLAAFARRTAILALLPGIAAATMTACTPHDVATAGAETTADHTVTVTATDYAFDAPAEVSSGMTTMILVNKGRELHHVTLLRLTDGKTAADLGAAMKQPGPLPAWAVAAGGPNAGVPGATSRVTFMLPPGNYVMLCVIPGPDHLPHVAKGMLRPLTVTDAKNAANTAPSSDLTLTLTDYAFTFSSEVTAGTHTFHVRNQGMQDHEAIFVRLAPGKSATDLAAWVDNQVGPPPAEPLGGFTAMAAGEQGYFTYNFTPGRYAVLCFVPDTHDGKPHVAHGMIKEFTI